MGPSGLLSFTLQADSHCLYRDIEESISTCWESADLVRPLRECVLTLIPPPVGRRLEADPLSSSWGSGVVNPALGCTSLACLCS